LGFYKSAPFDGVSRSLYFSPQDVFVRTRQIENKKCLIEMKLNRRCHGDWVFIFLAVGGEGDVIMNQRRTFFMTKKYESTKIL
jgi:hypothetical protein